MADQRLAVMKTWVALAWADGVIADHEAEAIKKLVAEIGFNDEDKATVLSWLTEKVELEPESIADLNASVKEGIYRAAARLATVDLKVDESEREFLAHLRTALSLDEEVAQKIEGDIPLMNSPS